MDAVKYLTELLRMCETILDCDSCPLGIEDRTYCDESRFDEYNMNVDNLKKAVSIVEKWSKQHPVKTRQSEFLQLFPNANLCNEVVQICPRKIDANSVSEEVCRNSKCSECYRNYWFADIGDQHE